MRVDVKKERTNKTTGEMKFEKNYLSDEKSRVIR